MTGYRVVKTCSWKGHSFRPGPKPLPEPDLLAAGLPPDVIAIWVANGAFALVVLPDPPPKIESPSSSAIESPPNSRIET